MESNKHVENKKVSLVPSYSVVLFAYQWRQQARQPSGTHRKYVT